MNTLLKRSIFWLIALCLIWLGGLFWFAHQLPVEKKPLPEADAIIVLTGGKSRLKYGLTLLADRKASRLFISGVHEKIETPQLLELMPEKLQRRVAKIGQSKVIIGRKAWNTIGNAEEALQWTEENNIHSILLVTSNYHMPRSLNEFHYYMNNMKITAAPVPVDDFHPLTWWLSKHYRRMLFSEYHKYLASCLRQAIIPALIEYSSRHSAPHKKALT